jgi:FAD/FMN-containing dehydrogenase
MRLTNPLRFMNTGWTKTLKRANYKVIDSADVEHFRTFLAPNQIITDPTDLEPFNQSWNKMEKGAAKLALTPTTTAQVASILSYCHANKIAVVPQGGNTGLVGGSVPVFDELILSTRHMNRILKFDKASSVLTVEAGVVLEKANDYLS